MILPNRIPLDHHKTSVRRAMEAAHRRGVCRGALLLLAQVRQGATIDDLRRWLDDLTRWSIDGRTGEQPPHSGGRRR